MTPQPVPEIFFFPSSEDISSVEALFNGVEGITISYHGKLEEDEKTAVWINVWESLEHHNTFTKSPSAIALFDAFKIPDKDKSSLNILHGLFSTPFLDALDAPVTEFVQATLRPGVTAEAFEKELVPKLHRGTVGVEGLWGMAWGPCVEREGVWAGVLGWDSVKTHVDAVSVDPMAALVKELLGLAELGVTHAKLTRCYEAGIKSDEHEDEVQAK